MKQIMLGLTSIILLWLASTIACKKEKDPPPVNEAPIARAGADQNIAVPSCNAVINVVLDGTSSSDPENAIKSYQWRYLTGPASFILRNASSVIAQLENMTAGLYTFELMITDAVGIRARDTVAIKVSGPVTTYDVDINFNGPFNFIDNYEDCYYYYYPCSFYDVSRFDGVVQVSPLGEFNLYGNELADTAASRYATNSYLYLYSISNNLSIGGSLSVNFKKLFQEGGGSFTGNFTIDNGSAQSCVGEVFRNFPPLSVTGTLNTATNVVSMRITGKAIF